MRNGFRVFDSHTHLGTARHSGRRQTVDQMVEASDRVGIDRSLLIPFPVVEDYHREHDEIAAAIRAYPDRFAGTACINPFIDEQAFRDEVRRCAEELGFRALKLQPQYQALNPLNRRGDFLYESALKHNLAVVVHTGAGAPFALPSLYIMVARRFPDLRIILGHAGGGLYTAEAIVAASVCPNIYIELSSLMPHHCNDVLSHIDSNRVMAGSDLPESAEIELGKIFTLSASDDAKRDILWRTARRVIDRVDE